MSEPYIVVCDRGTPRAEWLAARISGIGASEMPKLLGVGPASHGDAMTVYAAKVAPQGYDGEPEDGPLARGHELEPIILARAARDLAKLGVTAREDQRLLRSTAYPWALATVDGEASDGAPVELKSSIMVDLDEPPPEEWQVQCQQQMLVKGAGHAWLCALDVIEWRHRTWRLERDQQYLDTVLIPAGTAFWARVQERREPEATTNPQGLAAWRRLHPKDSGAVVALGEPALVLVSEWETAKERLAAAEKEVAAAKGVLELVMGEASEATLPDGTGLTYRTQERSGYTVAPTTFRVLRHVVPKKGKKA